MKITAVKTKKYFVAALILIALAVILAAAASSFKRKPVAGFPDIPAYPGATLISSSEIIDGTVKGVGKRYVATWESRQSAPVLSLWFRDNLPKYGWTLTIPPGDENMTIQQIDFGKDNTTLTVSLVGIGNKTEITVNYRPGLVIEDEEEEE